MHLVLIIQKNQFKCHDIQILCLCLGVLCPACVRDPFRSLWISELALSLSLVCRCDAGLRARWWTLQTRTRCIARSLECLCWSPPTTQTQRLVNEQHLLCFSTGSWLDGGNLSVSNQTELFILMQHYQDKQCYFLNNNCERMNPWTVEIKHKNVLKIGLILI